MTHYSFHPLERLIVDRRLENVGQVAALATRLGIPSDTIHRLRREGLRTDTADRLATAAGYHPCQVWDTWDEDIGVCACGEPISFASSGALCARCWKQLRDWERTRNRSLMRAFVRRLDHQRESVEPEGKVASAANHTGVVLGNAATGSEIPRTCGNRPGEWPTPSGGADVRDSTRPALIGAAS